MRIPAIKALYSSELYKFIKVIPAFSFIAVLINKQLSIRGLIVQESKSLLPPKMSGLSSSSSYVSFFHPVTWYQLINDDLLRQVAPQADKKQRHYNRETLFLHETGHGSGFSFHIPLAAIAMS